MGTNINNSELLGFSKRAYDESIHCSDIVKLDTGKFIIADMNPHLFNLNTERRKVFFTKDVQMLEFITLCRILAGKLTFLSNRYRRRCVPNAENLAHALWLAGAENITLSHSNMICSKHSIPFNMMLRPTSFSVRPYMEFGFTNGRNVLWYLLDIMGIRFSGGASSEASFMQASVLFARNDTHKPDLIKDTVLYFQALKDSFGLAKDYYSKKNKEDN